MPNWCDNQVTIAGSIEAVTQVVQAVSEKRDDGFHLSFGALFPRPEGLDGGAACDWSVGHWGTKWDLAEDEGRFDLWLDPATECLNASTSFSTAWGPPEEFFLRVGVQFPEVTISMEFDEPGMDFWGSRTIQGRHVIEQNGPSKLAVEYEEDDSGSHWTGDDCAAEHHMLHIDNPKTGEAFVYLACGAVMPDATLCRLYAGHEGPDTAGCVLCGGDWTTTSCECVVKIDA